VADPCIRCAGRGYADADTGERLSLCQWSGLTCITAEEYRARLPERLAARRELDALLAPVRSYLGELQERRRSLPRCPECGAIVRTDLPLSRTKRQCCRAAFMVGAILDLET
jgi:hypothetical protein